MAVTDVEDWPLQARCRGMNDALFPEGRDQKRAKTVCMGCPVRAQCLAEALDHHIEWGVWGGMTERERRQLLRQRPEVKSWAAVLTQQSDAQSPRLRAATHPARRRFGLPLEPIHDPRQGAGEATHEQ
ncbi:WhiB family transcriptional regulator [Propionibacterium freudenreichii]|jgi:WhiB family redox-sensing transcriptional regulator|nr:WhiB family transcriptional regulator [Propionibacterium freudenreichii]MDN5985004.1 WhiB family transcriptional regulator [Propionibacterium sp.]SPB31691.1 Transcriptional regulator WhiB4 [Propionibacterium freudenreichii subsp. shermanii]MCQ1998547.1 WhiB family transcriptional regulator [Propionibacterium freudenreichii]MCT2972812.1 WhiB family transcriptional regulator [Propionibacterium freudenreichii]MCT2976180.1 WhiB family transcriptional regulator [Propionibacterium freudenreichii]